MNPIAIPLHHEAPGDPTLMEWIKEQMDYVFGFGPEAMVAIFGLAVLAVPTLILFVYALQRRRD